MVIHKQDKDIKGSLLTVRKDVKVFDATVRDGGLINDHYWDDDFVRTIYDTCVAANIDYMEIGYKNSAKILAPAKFGPWKHCAEDDIRRVIEDNPSDLKISVMADAERVDYHTDIVPRDQSPLDVIRVATYIHQLPTAVDMIKDAHDKGYETFVNIMALSTVSDRALAEGLDILAKTPVDVIVIVDSFGSLYPEQVRDYALTYLKAVEGTGKEIGMHAHNNQELAFANTIQAMMMGVSCLDATINGIGRGAGNCSLELLVGFLKNPKFNLRPILETISKVFVPLRKDIEWGPMIPYILTGQLNMHPRSAIKMRAGDKPDDYGPFYDELLEGQ
ncbi:aldolase catalytic domain-containing protein [Candidatus Sumerlaeota bacterium]